MKARKDPISSICRFFGSTGLRGRRENGYPDRTTEEIPYGSGCSIADLIEIRSDILPLLLHFDDKPGR